MRIRMDSPFEETEITMNNTIDFCGIIVLLRKLKETGAFTEEELERVAARIAADTNVKIVISL